MGVDSPAGTPLTSMPSLPPPAIFSKVLTASKSWSSIPTIAAGGIITTSVTITGGVPNSLVHLDATPALPSGCLALGKISVDDTILVILYNSTGSVITLPDSTLSVIVFPL